MMGKIGKILVFTGACCFACSAAFAQSPSGRTVRIRIVEKARAVNVRTNTPCEIQCFGGGEKIPGDRNLKTVITVYNDVFLLGKKKLSCPRIFIKASGSGVITVNGRRFTGGILLVKTDSGHFSAINYTDLEDYIKGVLYHEVSHYWPSEVLKAQAIVSRSFALYQMRENAGRDFDLTNDIYSQVYGGKTSERYRTSKAVDGTAGSVLMYRGKILPAYYHSTCGGYTENASLLWNMDCAPLAGGPCDFCKDSPHFSWHTVIPSAEAAEKLRGAGYAVPSIREISLSGKDKSGRVTQVTVITDAGEVNIPAKDFRNILNPNVVRSTNFTVHTADHDLVFTGTGWGHGVGMCQW
ncbi:MAG: SpoIID/LytB domain-containing protein, partial [Candidatus Omnitrophica bacterium]|nr:SpoIID/LytB domain-containing protein [Candidatus Omnitrophota bacterium]